MLKSQDVLVTLKIASLHLAAIRANHEYTPVPISLRSTWIGWEADPVELAEYEIEKLTSIGSASLNWTYATLSKRVGISASECNEAVKRAIVCGIMRKSRNETHPTPIGKALIEFLVHGLKYVFPSEEGVLTRGIATGFAAPVLSQKLISAGEHVHVWPDARGNTTGLTLQPLHKAVPFAVRYDPILYELLALTDAIRFGKLRESRIASEDLKKELAKL